MKPEPQSTKEFSVSYTTFSLSQEDAVLRVRLLNPPVNLMSVKMIGELFQLGGQLYTDQKTKVVIVESADPEFFLAHVDIEDVDRMSKDPSAAGQYPDINALQALTVSWQGLPQVTIAKVAGRCRGGGLEFILGLTMRFASIDSKLCSPEAAVGFLACGGGTSRIGLLAGHARAMEFLLSARDFSGLEAERYGLINRALPPGDLNEYVESLAKAMARRSTAVLGMHRTVMRCVLAPVVEPMFAAFASENDGLRAAQAGKEMQQGIATMLAIKQTRENELDLPATMARVIAPQS
jgi:enoyl-CoA hydratase/carnithine racemase